uniref:Evasin P546 n=1 Tax=Amblyomma cajennense TaxID=34607 RepID=EV546_AMBCJ|nr:RecName: Full=Evasin P546; Flags: Precursor [Amblyomma cajennense]
MKVLLYIAASCLMLLALNVSAENTQQEEEDYDYGTDTCPFPVLANKTNKAKFVGCHQKCNGGDQKLTDGTACYVVERKVWDRMTPMLWYSCPLGECKNGVCEDLRKKEECRKGNGEEK